MKKVSIIIVTHNSEKDIFDCVCSLQRHADIPQNEIELIVVDNCSSNPQPMFEQLKQLWGEDLVCIENQQNGGYGQGNNIGIQHSTAPYIMIINPDVRIYEPIFRTSLQVFEEDEHLVLIGLTQRQQDGRIGRSTAWTTRIHPYIAEPLRWLTGKLNIYWDKYMYICGACFFLRKESFIQAGMFDEQIFMYGEEDDIHYRLMLLPGARMTYMRNLSYYHLHPDNKDYTKADYQWMLQNLTTLLYIARRDGLDQKRTILWAIKRNQITILKELFVYLISRGKNTPRLHYYQGWTTILRAKLMETTI